MGWFEGTLDTVGVSVGVGKVVIVLFPLKQKSQDTGHASLTERPPQAWSFRFVLFLVQ